MPESVRQYRAERRSCAGRRCWAWLSASVAAAQAILANIEGGTAFTTESGTLPGVTRSFHSVHEAARENADSRVYIGFHFRHATDEGVSAGLQVGQYVGDNSLQRVRGH